MFYRRSYCLYLFLLLTITSKAQTLPYKLYAAEDGLAHSIVYSTFQDSKGYIWFATDFGLSRFDGINFTNYTTNDGLLSNFIVSVAETDNHTLWIATYDKGLTKLQNGSFITCPQYKNNNSDKLLQIVADNENRIWLRNGKKETGYIENNAYKPIDIGFYTKDSTPYVTHHIFKCSDGSILLSTNKGAYKFQNGVIKSLIPGYSMPIYTIDEDNDKNLWLGSEGKIIRLSPNAKTTEITNTSILHKRIRDMKIDNAKRLWLGNYPQDITVINSETGETVYTDNIPVNDIFKDKENNLWVATFGQGVQCYNSSCITNYTIKDGLTDNIISEVTEDKNRKIWIATLRGINYIDSKTGRCEKFLKVEKDQQIYTLTTDYEDNLICGIVHTFCIIKNGKIKKTPLDRINYLYKEHQKKIWIATNHGVMSYENDSISKHQNLSGLNNKKVLCIAQDHDNMLWFGTNEGLFKYDGKNLTQITEQNAHKINAVYEDNSKKMWLATDTGISFLLNNKWYNYPSSLYMNNAVCLKIINDSNGNIWIGTNKGLFVFNGKTFSKLYHKTGLAGTEIKSLFIDTKNTLWVGTMKGLSKVDLNLYTKEKTISALPIYIQNVKINGTPINLAKDILIPLKYSENNISIDFTALFYKNPEDIFYEYKLSGTTGNWYKTQNRSVEFSSLSPGSYTFWVKAVNSSDTYSAPARFSFTIAPPFWAKTGFIIFEFIFGITAIALLFSWRMKIYKQKTTEKLLIHKQLINLEHRALSALMNPHFIFNVLNSIQYYMKYVNVEQAHDYLKKFTKLIRLNFENAKHNYNTLENEIVALELFCSLEQLRFDDTFTFRVNLTSEIDPHDTYVPSILIQPFVENAIWHGLIPAKRKGNILVSISSFNGILIIKITDNGVGINASKNNTKKHRSSAIEITGQRLAIIGKLTDSETSIKISDLKESDPSQTGTEVEICLPVMNHSSISDHIIA